MGDVLGKEITVYIHCERDIVVCTVRIRMHASQNVRGIETIPLLFRFTLILTEIVGKIKCDTMLFTNYTVNIQVVSYGKFVNANQYVV